MGTFLPIFCLSPRSGYLGAVQYVDDALANQCRSAERPEQPTQDVGHPLHEALLPHGTRPRGRGEEAMSRTHATSGEWMSGRLGGETGCLEIWACVRTWIEASASGGSLTRLSVIGHITWSQICESVRLYV